MPRILLIRMSSMGDIIHNFPAVTDLRAHYPDADVHWVVEEAFVGLARLHPGVTKVVPIALRRWRKRPWAPAVRAEMSAFRQALQAARYEVAIDSQGLIKSAVVGKLSGAALAGYSRKTARDPLATLFYDRRFDIPPVHVIERNRQLTGSVMGYAPEGGLDYGIQPLPGRLDWQPHGAYVVCLTATARDAKLWAEPNWIALGQWLLAQGLQPVFPWGSEAERQRAERIAMTLPGSIVAPRFSLVDAARLLADARAAIGVDTGLMHLAAAVDTPTVGIFVDSDPHHAGARARTFSQSLGGVQQPPSFEVVRAVVEAALAAKG
ncbi:lipopolysaccharide heptosyltransferase I [Chitinimonas sp. BJYL2]|uniref:lipopolysaccharide heptosyltransferase I n=1 Tax=Chitinimonas sp. BJYL2 TaxID=2976696 RepID=UPI0022B4E61E|nr:lipopolysaccharide heptosyltransferase I [Chitinimonas sp. BJYL2]